MSNLIGSNSCSASNESCDLGKKLDVSCLGPFICRMGVNVRTSITGLLLRGIQVVHAKSLDLSSINVNHLTFSLNVN